MEDTGTATFPQESQEQAALVHLGLEEGEVCPGADHRRAHKEREVTQANVQRPESARYIQMLAAYLERGSGSTHTAHGQAWLKSPFIWKTPYFWSLSIFLGWGPPALGIQRPQEILLTMVYSGLIAPARTLHVLPCCPPRIHSLPTLLSPGLI